MTKKDMKLPIIRFFIICVYIFSPIEIISQIGNQNDTINSFYKKANSAHQKGDYEDMFNNLCLFVKYNTDTADYRLKKAYYDLGHLYAHGHFVKQNVDSAIVCFIKSSNYGHSESSRFLFDIYYFSNYNKTNINEALKWLKISADQGNFKSIYELGELYEMGETYQLKDTTVAAEYTSDGEIRSVKNIVIKTKHRLSFPFLKKDERTAYDYYEKAVNYSSEIIGRKVGNYEIAVLYMDGIIFEKDFYKALDHLRECIPTSINEIIKNIDKYSNEKDADALWRLSLLYRFGLGTIDNEKKANDYLKLAAKCGNQKAINALKFIEL